MDITEARLPRPKVKAFLVVHGGRHDGRVYVLGNNLVKVGRDSHFAHFVLDDHTVSREHIQLRLEGDQFSLTDLDTANGTYVNGKRVNRCTLADNDYITIGNTNLVYKHVSPDLGRE